MQIDASEALIQNILQSEKWGTLAFVIIEILFWGLLAGFLHKKGIYIKLQRMMQSCKRQMLCTYLLSLQISSIRNLQCFPGMHISCWLPFLILLPCLPKLSFLALSYHVNVLRWGRMRSPQSTDSIFLYGMRIDIFIC